MSNQRYIMLAIVSGCLMLSGCNSNKRVGNFSSTYENAKLSGQSKKEKREEAVRIKTELAVAYMNSGNYRLATQTIDSTLKEHDTYDLAWLVRAQIYQHLKVFDKAEESFKRALKLSPKGAEINNNYGWFLCQSMNRPQDAIAYFDVAISDPTYPSPETAYFNKGICYTKMQQFQMAESNFERALQMNPQFTPIFKERARSFMIANNIKEADRLFRQYQSMVDRLSADDLLLGWKIAKHQGLSQAALEYEMQLRSLYPYSDELKAITTGELNHEFDPEQSDDDTVS